MATFMAELNIVGVFVTAVWTGQLPLKQLTAFATELDALGILGLAVWALHETAPPLTSISV